MPYTTAPTLTDEFGAAELIQLTDRETPQSGAIVTAVLDRAIEKADAKTGEHRYLALSRLVDELGRMLGGWIVADRLLEKREAS